MPKAMARWTKIFQIVEIVIRQFRQFFVMDVTTGYNSLALLTHAASNYSLVDLWGRQDHLLGSLPRYAHDLPDLDVTQTFFLQLDCFLAPHSFPIHVINTSTTGRDLSTSISEYMWKSNVTGDKQR